MEFSQIKNLTDKKKIDINMIELLKELFKVKMEIHYEEISNKMKKY